MIAALFVATGGCYFGLPDVDPWDITRDARKYNGPHPVVAHPPCERWGRYWYGGPMLHKLGRRKTLGDDGGCFAAAFDAVNQWGGVLEHPEASHAWRHFKIPSPPRQGGWVSAGLMRLGGSPSGTWVERRTWTCCVEQGHYGHRARKATWLYAVLPKDIAPPSLTWGKSAAGVRLDQGFHSKEERRAALRLGTLRAKGAQRMHRSECAATPLPFRDVLLSIARNARGPISAPCPPSGDGEAIGAQQRDDHAARAAPIKERAR